LQRDLRTVLTLDAGGTTFTFSALRGGAEIVEPLTLAAQGHDLEACLEQLRLGFAAVRESAGAADALSFAFPGPADYRAGVIGDLWNLPGFRGGVPLGPILEAQFGVPVYINNDGDLFAYGEALAGLLPEVNGALEAAGSPRRHRNLLGLTLGTGFGGGIVRDGQLFLGDNGAAAEVWLLRHRNVRDAYAEEGVSLRAVKRVYSEIAEASLEAAPDPKLLAAIARGHAEGHREAALEAFRQFGEIAGDAIANALTLVDGVVVLGGGLCGAADLFLPALLGELNGTLHKVTGQAVPRLELQVTDWDDLPARAAFLAAGPRQIRIPGTPRQVAFEPVKRVPLGLSRLGTSRATALGAYAFALAQLDRQ
jgi:glucokinase